MAFAKDFSNLNKWKVLAFGLFGLGIMSVDKSVFYVPVGSFGIKFNRLTGNLTAETFKEGYHLNIPYIEEPILYNVQTRDTEIFAQTANRDMQNIKICVKVLYHPDVHKLNQIHLQLGPQYDAKVINTITNEILRTVVAKFSASQLLSQRDQVSERIRSLLQERASHFNVIIDNLAITELTFGSQYLGAIEGKQVAQQEAERAKYQVEQAKESKKSTIIKAQASAKSIELVGEASMNNPSYLDFRRIEYTEKIAFILAETKNKVMLSNSILNMKLPPVRETFSKPHSPQSSAPTVTQTSTPSTNLI